MNIDTDTNEQVLKNVSDRLSIWINVKKRSDELDRAYNETW